MNLVLIENQNNNTSFLYKQIVDKKIMKTRKEKFKELWNVIIRWSLAAFLYVLIGGLYFPVSILIILLYPIYYYGLNYNNTLGYLLSHNKPLRKLVEIFTELEEKLTFKL